MTHTEEPCAAHQLFCTSYDWIYTETLWSEGRTTITSSAETTVNKVDIYLQLDIDLRERQPQSAPHQYSDTKVLSNTFCSLHRYPSTVSSSGRSVNPQRRMPYSLPQVATAFTVNFPDEEYLQLQQLLRLSRIGPVTWENQHTDGRYGVPRNWLQSTKDYWLTEFDWPTEQRRINSFPNYKLRVADQKGDVDLHFIALLSTREDAMPLVLLHGWPGSFLEFLPTLELAREKYSSDALPFHIIVPSLPGYTLSSGPPPDKAWTAEDAARIIHNGLQMLNLSKYVVQGGDVGSLIASILANEYKSVIGIHCEYLYFSPSPRKF